MIVGKNLRWKYKSNKKHIRKYDTSVMIIAARSIHGTHNERSHTAGHQQQHSPLVYPAILILTSASNLISARLPTAPANPRLT